MAYRSSHLRRLEAMQVVADGAELIAKLYSTKDAVPDAPAYSTTRRQYRSSVSEAVSGYLDSSKPIGVYKRNMGRAMLEAFSDAFYRGYSDAGGDDTEHEDDQWLTDKQNQELGYINELFSSLKDIRARGDEDLSAVIANRVDGYTGTLDGVYSEGKLRGSKNKMLEFGGTDGQESCPDCQRLLGKRRTIKWILAHDMIPRPGNEAFECRGFECQHFWFDPRTGERYTR